MDKATIRGWIRTMVIAMLGGGIAGAFAAAMDPRKYHFPHDFGSGKLWEYFAEGALTVGLATAIKSPLGQKALAVFKDSQQQLSESHKSVEDTKAEIKESIPPRPPSQ
jgi:hypothetical protein